MEHADGPDAAAVSEMERSREGVRRQAARAYALATTLDRVTTYGCPASIGIIAAGKTYLDMRQALRALGLERRNWRPRRPPAAARDGPPLIAAEMKSSRTA